MRSALLLLASISILLCAPTRSAAQGNVLLQSSSGQNPSAQELLDRAHSLVDLSKVEPYVMTADVISDPGNHERKGRLTIYRDHDRARFELQVGEGSETQVMLGNTIYFDPGKTLFSSSGLSGIDQSWDPDPSNDAQLRGNYRLSGIKAKRAATGGAWCLKQRYNGKFTHEEQLCFDVDRGVLASRSDARDQTLFLDYKAVGNAWVPAEIKLFQRMRVPITLANIELVQKPLDANLFAPPPGSLDLEKCDDMKPPQAVSTPEPSFSQYALGWKPDGKIVMNAVIDKQGIVASLRVVNSDDPYETPDAIRAVKDWRFKPATCQGRPVNTLMQIEVLH